MPAANKKNGVQVRAKARGPAEQSPSHNAYGALFGNDGSPQTLKEFDESNPEGNEVFFNAAEDADEATIMRCLILNYIHKQLRVKVDRVVGYELVDTKEIEVYNHDTFLDTKLAVCVYFTSIKEGGKKECFAVVKQRSDDLNEDGAWDKAIWSGLSKAAKDKDSASDTVEGLDKFLWTPRWKYVVEALNHVAYNDYDKYGVQIIHPEPEVKPEATKKGRPDGECIIQIFSGCLGKVIGPGGAMMKELRSKSGNCDIQLPPKPEDGVKRRARELIDITLKGTGQKMDEAEKLIMAIQKEWADAPRGGAPAGGFVPSGAPDAYAAAEYVPEGGNDGPEDWADAAIKEAEGPADWENGATTTTTGGGEW